MIEKLKVTDKNVIDQLYEALIYLPRWKRKVIKWLWPDIIKVADTLREYYWGDEDNG